jgi:hypothetical protein
LMLEAQNAAVKAQARLRPVAAREPPNAPNQFRPSLLANSAERSQQKAASTIGGFSRARWTAAARALDWLRRCWAASYMGAAKIATCANGGAPPPGQKDRLAAALSIP